MTDKPSYTSASMTLQNTQMHQKHLQNSQPGLFHPQDTLVALGHFP